MPPLSYFYPNNIPVTMVLAPEYRCLKFKTVYITEPSYFVPVMVFDRRVTPGFCFRRTKGSFTFHFFASFMLF